MILYQGSKFVRYNKFKDSKGNILVFEKATKNGKLFKTGNGYVTLTESQANKLLLLKDLEESTKYDEYTVRQKIKSEVGEIISKYWQTVYTDEQFYPENLLVDLPSTYDYKDIVKLSFPVRTEPFYPIEGLGSNIINELKAALKEYGLQGISFTSKKVKPNWVDTPYRMITSISFKLLPYLKAQDISYKEIQD